MTDKWVYSFGDGDAEGDRSLANELGGKGANLAEMSKANIPVPPGFTITTDVCASYYKKNFCYPDELKGQVAKALLAVEKLIQAKLGNAKTPLLVSVRSGAAKSMPGMMDTVLNLGLNDRTVDGLAEQSKDTRFAYDSYRRFIQMYSDVVLGIDHYAFEDLLENTKQDKGVTLDKDLEADDLKLLVENYKRTVLTELGIAFPQDPEDQLWGAIGAVFKSWMNPRAITYRKLNGLMDLTGTAVTVQSMVFGNMGDDCATGVCFSRDPSTGVKGLYGEYLTNAQGEDVVAGIRTPQQITILGKEAQSSKLPAMEEIMPDLYAELCGISNKLEKHYGNMQDMEFTVQKGKLWMLQTRSGKRSAKAAIKIAIDMVADDLLSKPSALMTVQPDQLDQLLHPMLDPEAPRELLSRGLPASPGAASGMLVFSAEEAEDWAKNGERVILVRQETSPEDIGGMHVAEGILTSRGGMTSHAAVVARGMGTPCVCGAGEIQIDVKAKTMAVRGVTVVEGDMVTLDGSTGEIFLGQVASIQPELSDDFITFMEWVDKERVLRVRANAETPADAETARKFGAEGIGLCRTEHMFFDPERIVSIRHMILAGDENGRRKALAKLLPFQRQDFLDLFRIMDGVPVTIRLLDPPLHEFLPHSQSEIAEVAKSADVSVETVEKHLQRLHESNPMLGHRGCRLGVTYPEIYEVQARAIFEAAVESLKSEVRVFPEVMIPLVSIKAELEITREIVDATAEAVFTEMNAKVDYNVGTMIELPRAALAAGEIAEVADFYSFGTNDLTQTTLGMSRDDSAPFLDVYTRLGIYQFDPFVTLDAGVKELVRLAAERGRNANEALKLGICGEHGGDPETISFCHDIGLDYVSCSPYRVPVARLAAAQARIRQLSTVS